MIDSFPGRNVGLGTESGLSRWAEFGPSLSWPLEFSAIALAPQHISAARWDAAVVGSPRATERLFAGS